MGLQPREGGRGQQRRGGGGGEEDVKNLCDRYTDETRKFLILRDKKGMRKEGNDLGFRSSASAWTSSFFYRKLFFVRVGDVGYEKKSSRLQWPQSAMENHSELSLSKLPKREEDKHA